METKRRELKSFDKEFTAVTFSQAIAGIILPDKDDWQRLYKIWQFSMISMYCLSCTLTAATAVISYNQGDITETTRQIGLMILCTYALVKNIVFLYHKGNLLILRKIVDADYIRGNCETDERFEIIMDGIRSGLFLEKLIVRLMVLTGLMMIFVPGYTIAKDHLLSNTAPRQLIISFDLIIKAINDRKTDPGFLEVIILYTLLNITVIGSNFIGFESVVMIYLNHICTQIRLLHLSISNLFLDNCNSSYYDANLTSRRIADIVRHHLRILRMAKLMQETFRVYFLICITFVAILICMSLFQVVEGIEEGTFTYFHVLVITITIVLYLILHNCQKVINESEELVTAVYGCGWENIPDLANRRKLILILAQCQYPITMSTGFAVLCVNTFTTIMQAACNYFMIIYNTGE